MIGKILGRCTIAALALFLASGTAMAGTIKLNSSEWLGSLKLEKSQLTSIKKAVEEALNAPIDAEQQCGKIKSDCVVRAAREWEYNGDKYREIVIHLHTLGHSSRAVQQEKGKWPAVAAN